MPWVLRSSIGQQFPVHAGDGDFLAQQTNIDLVELQRAVLEDSVITVILFAESWRIRRNHAVAVGMLSLDGLPACPQDTCHVDEIGVRRKELTEGIQIVAVPSRCEPGDNVSHVLHIILRRENAVRRQGTRALNALTVAMALELGPDGIKVNAVSPGYTKTNLNGYSGTETVEEGAREAVRVALLGADGPTGKFTRWENETISL